MMLARHFALFHTLAGYEKTGVQLIGYDDAKLFPSGISDDIGLYYFVPKLVRLLHCSLDQAINLFFYGMMACALVVGIAGFCALTKSWVSRSFAIIYLIMFSVYSCWGMTDIYLVFAASAVALIPWALYFMQRGKADYKVALFFGVVGVLSGYAQYVRAYSSGAVVLMSLLVIFFISSARQRKFMLLGALCCGMVLPIVHMRALLAHRTHCVDTVLHKAPDQHVLWHTMYAGFGFLRNDFGIQWDDATVVEHAHRIDPAVVYPSLQYEKVVRGMVFDLVKHHPQFVLQTLFAKFGVMLYYLLFFANIGLLLALLYRKPWQIDFMFFVALAFNSLFGFIALPGKYYLLGALTCAVLYCIVSFDYAVRQGMLRDLWRRIRA